MPKKIKRMNKGLFIVRFLVPSLIFVVLLCMSILEVSISDEIVVIVFLAAVICSCIFSTTYNYLLWSAVYDERYMNVTPLMYALHSLFIALILRQRWRRDTQGSYYIFPYDFFFKYYDMYVDRHELKMPPIDRSAYRPYRYMFISFWIVFLFIALLHILVDIPARIFLILFVLFFIILVKTFLDTVSHTCDAVNALADAVDRNYRQNRNMGRRKDIEKYPSDIVEDGFHRDRNVEHPVKAAKGSGILIIPRGDKKS